jgi:hypothetical protein
MHSRTRSLSLKPEDVTLAFVAPLRAHQKRLEAKIGVPEPVPAEVRNSNFLAGFSQDFLLNGCRCVWHAGHGNGENPVVLRTRTSLLPLQQCRCKGRV